MRATIYLDPTVPKCVAANYPCSRKDTCALHLVSTEFRRFADFTSPDGCSQYRAASDHLGPPVMAPRTHEYVKGMI